MNNELIEQPSWWKRNWKWAVPVGGCLTLIIIVVVAGTLGIFGIVNSVKENTNYDEVLARVQQNEAVIYELGEPIEKNGIGSFNISYNNGERKASAVAPIKGPNGLGEIYVTTSGDKEDPIYEYLEVYIEATDSIINLLPVIEESDSSSEDF